MFGCKSLFLRLAYVGEQHTLIGVLSSTSVFHVGLPFVYCLMYYTQQLRTSARCLYSQITNLTSCLCIKGRVRCVLLNYAALPSCILPITCFNTRCDQWFDTCWVFELFIKSVVCLTHSNHNYLVLKIVLKILV